MEGEQWTASSSSSLASITDLPSHILMDILCRLPIKTLVPLKFVCKSWLHLINDPFFSKLRQASSKLELCFLKNYHDNETIKLFTGNISSLINDSLDTNLETLYELPKLRGYHTFLNSCNLFLCYGSECGFAVICNPFASVFKIVLPPRMCKGWSRNFSYTFGFGFSQRDKRFKLLCIFRRRKKESSREDVVVVKIRTIEKTGSWKTICSLPYSSWNYTFEPCGNGTLLHGKLHWLSQSSDWGILSFDFDDEMFSRVQLPPHFKTRKVASIKSRIGVLGDCLYVTETTDRSYNTWLMKEYGDHGSWTQVISLEFTSIERNKCMWCIPLSYLENGEILMKAGYNLFLYDPVLKCSTTISSCVYFDYVLVLNPSLVPLKDSIIEDDTVPNQGSFIV